MLLNLLIFISVFALFWLVARALDGNRKRMQGRIDRLKNRKASAAKTMQDMSLRRKTTQTSGLLQMLMKPLPDFKRLGYRLERVGKDITPKQYALRRVLTALLIAMVISGMFHAPLVMGLTGGLVLGIWLPLKLLQRAIGKLDKAFIRLFPDALDLIVRGLRSGLPVSESLVLVSQEVPQPVSGIFTNVSNTMKLGVPMEKALQDMARKLDMTEFDFFTTGIILQRETGGNLSEILNNLSEVLRGRYIMRMKIRAISSEARASTYIIGALPFLVILAVSVLSPGYLSPLYTDPHGKICAMVAVFMMSFGLWVMNRMSQFQI